MALKHFNSREVLVRKTLMVLGASLALSVPVSAASAEPITIHEEGTAGKSGCGVHYDTGWYTIDPQTGQVSARGPHGSGDFEHCL